MSLLKPTTAILLVLGLAACTPSQNVAPSGIGATGSAGTQGGAAAPPAGSGTVGVSRP